MIFEIYIPSFPLSQFIESFLYYKDYDPVHSVERFLPDGNVYLVIDFTDLPKPIYHNQTLKEIQSCKRAWFSGIRNKYITIRSGKGNEMFVINFRKGKAYPFVEMPMNEFTDHVVDGELVMSDEILNMRDALLNISCINQKFLYAEQYLLKTFCHKLIVNPFIDYAVHSILQSPEQLAISRLSARIGFSQKHFIKLFKEHVGVTPKAFVKIMRFQKAIQEIEANRNVHWASIAYESGYYDQAHFISDFKDFSGFTPKQYLGIRNDYTNYIALE